MKYVLGAAAALVLAATAAPAAIAGSGWAGVELNTVSGWYPLQPNGRWYIRGGMPGSFSVDVTNRSDHDVSDLYLRISFPPSKLEVVGYEGDHWDCWDVEGGPGVEGVHCRTAGFLAGPGKSFPTLLVRTMGREHHTDTLDVYAETAGEVDAHAGVPYSVDLST
ncbi:hypothetical protein [Lentzea sp. NPDC004782]|uniref:hypothetical protein n=1 Tax=Lentzea sp. NPDC004782 TaxID=3154458 RepID=UPI0033B085DE